MELPTWLDPELVRVVGSGATLAGLEVARAQETLPEAMAGPIFSILVGQGLGMTIKLARSGNPLKSKVRLSIYKP